MTNPNEYTFTVRGGRIVIEGKANWPDFLSIRLDRRDALDLISQIASQLRYDIEDAVTVSFMGQMGRQNGSVDEAIDRLHTFHTTLLRSPNRLVPPVDAPDA